MEYYGVAQVIDALFKLHSDEIKESLPTQSDFLTFASEIEAEGILQDTVPHQLAYQNILYMLCCIAEGRRPCKHEFLKIPWRKCHSTTEFNKLGRENSRYKFTKIIQRPKEIIVELEAIDSMDYHNGHIVLNYEKFKGLDLKGLDLILRQHLSNLTIQDAYRALDAILDEVCKHGRPT